ncbi:MAG: hypothetical protein D3914_12290 [Candidatus Electrothrix sp. LOE2]|nr:hypothetical protein [Candidatus Electrothrix sp. LOE2]
MTIKMTKNVKITSCLFCFFFALGTGSQHAIGMETADSLSLVGTVIEQQVGNKAVLLDETEQKQYILREGDTIANTVVRKVERGRVVLLRNGQEQVLLLKNRKGKGTPDKAAQKISLADLMPPPPPPAPAPVIP